MVLAIIDDKSSQRTSFKRKIERHLKPTEWSVIDSAPFSEFKEYFQWIQENEISALILDERLTDNQIESPEVDMFGHEVAKYLKELLPDFPIFSITNYERTNDLRNSIRDFNLILGRRKFDEDIDNYLNTIIKFGEDYYKLNKEKLSRLAEVSELIAMGNRDESIKEELRGLQMYFSIPHLSAMVGDRSELLDDVEKTLSEIEVFIKDIRGKLK